ncbi:hypothetical protein A33M_0914 [Rhodovulum sp. PH10]|nr:hypothetical protein A33M_0914 [Rhodovulum sp. PH10]
MAWPGARCDGVRAERSRSEADRTGSALPPGKCPLASRNGGFGPALSRRCSRSTPPWPRVRTGKVISACRWSRARWRSIPQPPTAKRCVST